MSSNPIHITRSNYEEAFLLYIDNELSADERAAVETFALVHPDLGEELELLQGTKLDTGSFIFDDKESLLADQMQETVVDENLLLYIDNELSGAERRTVELGLAANPFYQAQHNALLETKLNPADTIVYPYKAELYQKEEDRKRPFFWMRAAAAVILVAGGVSFFSLRSNGPDTVEVAKITPFTKSSSNPITQPTVQQPVVIPSVEEKMMTVADIAAVEERKELKTSKVKAQPAVRFTMPKQNLGEQDIARITPPSQEDRIPEEVLQARHRTLASSTETPQQNINTNPVTTADAPTYTNHTAAEIKPSFAGGIEQKDDRNQGSVRGLLRKATRFIERHTGIKSTDDDDRVLAGPLAISLK
ncbi:MAG: hypothetical protein JWP88_2176 [Flaviaesturariibacter sp.]|nr:hypothetical protein [Flaviaesturariibacter sp.]